MPCSSAYGSSQVLGQVVAVGDPHRSEHHGAADNPEKGIQPHRTEPEAELATTTATQDEEGDDPDTGDPTHDPAPGLSQRAPGPTSEKLEGQVHGGDGPTAGGEPGEATPHQQSAQGHDERGNADIGDDRALEGADQGAEDQSEQRE